MKKPFPFHHFLFAVVPILFLYSHNASKIPISPSELLLPVAVSIGAALLLWLLLTLVFRSLTRSALVVTVLLVLFFLYGHLYGLYPHHYVLAIGAFVLLAMACAAVARSRSSFATLTVLLNLVAAGLLAVNLVTGIPAMLRNRESARTGTEQVSDSSGKPDIYFITLDGYGRSDVLRTVFGFDNTDFIGWLRSQGFRVADKSRANYATTFQSFASTLNMTYLDTVVQRVGEDNDDLSVLTRMIKTNAVVRFLKKQGYTIVALASGYTGTGLKDADFEFAPRWALSEFQNVLISTTALPPILDLLVHKSQFDVQRERILYQFRRLPDAASLKHPVFVFCHILAPHPPFVFGPNGEKTNPEGPFRITEGGSFETVDKARVRREYIEGYRNQATFITSQARSAVERTLARSPTTPVIIIQGDHGPGAILNWDDPEPEEVRERIAILNACLMPDTAGFGWYDSISRVNTFRVIFSKVFGNDLPPLPDRSYYASIVKPFKFYDVDSLEGYEALHPDTQPSMAIVAFRAAREKPANPGTYARRLLILKYGRAGYRVAQLSVMLVDSVPSPERALELYRGYVAKGELPDFGTGLETFSGSGPEGEPVTALYFPVRRPQH